ncbi:CBF-domain-containing protein [Trametopsis cervina]|nr:CBF-domain-containing protein [Trametopsis cervina]
MARTPKIHIEGQEKPSKKSEQSRKKKVNLEEHVVALGGEQADIELVQGSRDAQLVQGETEEDPKLKDDVSKFLSDLSLGKNSASRSKSKNKLEPVQRPEAPKARSQKKAKNQKEPAPESPAEVPAATLAVTGVKSSNGNGKLLFSANAHWYTATLPLPSQPKPLPSPSSSQIASLSQRAASLFEKDTETYQASSTFTGKSTSDTHFLNTILSKGTLSDRLSALTLLVQASPVHNTKALDTLKGMAERGRGKGGRDEGLKAVRCVVDWWIGGGAPSRKLRYFRDQPLLHPSVTDQHLISWHFEDWLKKYFFAILQILETYSLDPLPYVRTQALSFITTLLREKPEQEQNLLRLLVNKMGDTEKSVCSRASYHLLQVLQAHPAMKSVIVREVRSLVFKQAGSTSTTTAGADSGHNSHIRFGDSEGKSGNTKGKGKDKTSRSDGKSPTMERWNSHAWYYAAVTLNQVVLTANDHDRDVARTLIDLYFEMFREILGGTVGGGGEDDPHSKADAADDETAPQSSSASKRKGKAKETRGDAGFAEVEDANSRLISAVLTGVNRALPFAKVDMDVGGGGVFKTHIDTLFLITHTSTFNISLQALLLILQIVANFPAGAASTSKDAAASFFTTLTDRFYRTLYASLADQRLGTSNKQAMYLNLVFKALKADKNLERVKAFVRRFIQVLAVGIGGSSGVEFITGGLYLLGELFGTIPGLRSMFTVPATTNTDAETYDPRKCDPQYAHASASPLYELLPLLHHYHPAVSLHARQLLSSQPVTATPDLSLNTLSHFLDRFVFKNPKKPKAKGASAMQPAASGDAAGGAGGVKLLRGEVANGEGPINEEKFWRRRVEDVPVDEIFFYKYFNQKDVKEKSMASKVKKRKNKGDEEDADSEEGDDDNDDAVDGAEEEADKDNDDEEGNSDAEEAEIWKAMKASLPAELQDEDLSMDSDDVPEDLDDSEEEDGGVDVSGDDEDVSEAEEEEEEEDEDEEKEDEEEDEDDAISLVEASDNEDLVSLDALIDFDGPHSSSDADPDEEEWGGLDAGSTKRKRAAVEEDDTKKKRKKIRSLPTFASYEEYAKMIEDGPEDNI